MSELLRPDICVIGAGAGGVTAAMTAAVYGVPVVLVENNKMGGTHLNTGSVPSQALIAAARRAETLRHAKSFGLNAPRAKVDFYRIHDHIRSIIEAASPNLSRERLSGLGVQVIDGTGRFKDAKTLAVGEAIEIKARRFIIATGSSPAIPEIPGIEQAPYLTNETIFDLLACPKHLVVIGAGSTGLSLAQAFRRLGAEVTVLEAAQPLAEHDSECAAIVLNQLEREGIAIRAGVQVVRVKSGKSKVQLFVTGANGEERIEASHLLVAAGRMPNIEELNLDVAGVAYGRNGIVVDGRLRTSNKKVYAIGDVAGGPPFTHVAKAHADIVIRNALFRLPAKVRHIALPQVTYTEPELAHIGLTETEARQRHRAFQVLRWPYRENDRALAERQINGHVKVITSKGGKILGVTIVGTHAGELITAWALAVKQGMNVHAFADLAVACPTYSEISKQAAVSYFASRLARPWIRRIIAVLRLLG